MVQLAVDVVLDERHLVLGEQPHQALAIVFRHAGAERIAIAQHKEAGLDPPTLERELERFALELLDGGRAAPEDRLALLRPLSAALAATGEITRAHELLPGSHLEIVPGAPHSMYWETPGPYNAAIAHLRRTLTAPKARKRVMTSCTNTSGAEAPAVRPTRRRP